MTQEKSESPKKVKLLSRVRRVVRKRLRKHPFIVPVVSSFAIVMVGCVLFVSFNAQTVGASDSRLVSLYIEGKERIVPTRAATVAEFVDKLSLDLAPEDLIEPSLETPILDDNFKIAIYKATPATVIDKGKHYVVKTPYDDPRVIAEKAGLKIYAEDIVERKRNEDFLEEGTIGDTIVVNRATSVVINLYGQPVDARTRKGTVRELLAEKQIAPAPDDTVQPGLDSPVQDGMTLFVTSVGREVRTVEEVIPAPVVKLEDPNAANGTTVVREAGANGKKVVTYEIELKNGAEVSRKVLQESIIAEPVQRVVVVGTKVIISDPGSVIALGQQIANEMGYGSQFNCIDAIFSRESHWNPYASNRSSGAYGIPQALPGSKMGPGWQTDPAVQIRWGIGYMVGRYGSPCGAWNFWQVNHWY